MNLQFQQLSEIDSQPVQWLWTDRIPFGAITMLDGEDHRVCCSGPVERRHKRSVQL